MMLLEDLNLTLSTTLLCWTLYWALVPLCNSIWPDEEDTPPTQNLVDASRLVAILYAGVAAIWSTYLLLNWSETHARTLLCVSLGYFLWDLLICTLLPREMGGAEMWLHAAVSSVGYACALQPFLVYEATALLLFQWSTPCLHLYRLAQAHRGKVMWQMGLALSFAGIFVAIRVLWGTGFILGHVVPKLYQQYNEGQLTGLTALGVTTLALTLCSLNWIWFFRIQKMVVKLTRK